MRATTRIGSLVLISSALAACSGRGAYEKPPTPVKVSPVEAYSASTGVRFSASIEPFAETNLAFRVGGYVTGILELPGDDGKKRLVQEGDRVGKGTVLARVREEDYAEKVDQARASLAQAKALAVQAKADFDRASSLLESRSLTGAEYDAAKARYDSSRAAAEGAEAVLAEAETAAADAALRSPMDAIILKRTINIGDLIAPGHSAFVLADTTSVKVVFAVPDMMVQDLRIGQALTITTEAIRGTDFPSRITRISPSADPKSRTFEVEVTIPNADGRLKAGVIASLQVSEGGTAQSVTVVPLTAIVRPPGRPEGYAVVVAEGEGDRAVARLRDVRLGEAFGNMIAVTEGLRIGERVIVTGATLVVDGDPIRIIP